MKKLLISSVIALSVAGIAYAADLTVESQTQHFNDANHRIDLEGNVKVKYDDVNVMSPRAHVILDPKNNRAEKVRFLDNAYSYQVNEKKKHEVKAKILEVSLLDKVFKADGRTQSTVLNGQEPTIIVTADKQEYDNKSNVMKAKGSVIIYYKDTQAFADYAQVNLDKQNDLEKMILQGNAYIKKDKSTIKANKFVHLAKTEVTTATGNVFSDINEEKTQIKVWSDFQQVDQKSNVITASGHAKIHYKDIVATGPKATVYPDANNNLNKVVFLGRSKIEQEGRSIEADRINMTFEPKDFKADGNVKTFIPNISGSKNKSTNL